MIPAVLAEARDAGAERIDRDGAGVSRWKQGERGGRDRRGHGLCGCDGADRQRHRRHVSAEQYGGDGDVDYVRRVSLNVARVAAVSTTAGAATMTVTLAAPLLAGVPAAGMKLAVVLGFTDRLGGSYAAEWSALFVMDGVQGDRVLVHYPRLQSAPGATEVQSAVAAGLERWRLRANFHALPVTDPNDGEAVLCFRSYCLHRCEHFDAVEAVERRAGERQRRRKRDGGRMQLTIDNLDGNGPVDYTAAVVATGPLTIVREAWELTTCRALLDVAGSGLAAPAAAGLCRR